MTLDISKRTRIVLSVYGYGMICFSTAIAILLVCGFFTRPNSDLYFSWGVSIFAGASGALAIAMVKSHFPYTNIRNTLIAATILNVFLFGSYLTSYLGYSRLAVVIQAPGFVDHAAIQNLCTDLRISWLSTLAASVFCTLIYFFIEWAAQSFVEAVNTIPAASDSHPNE